ncbi:hypothetical protein [Thermococcus sp.]|uniref:hypothetical protein n=1 Tax=Thermococcus sp. TaxID=35749 RepID=UPI0019BD855B|nr:hypothetical protein [Thermococcus sp.]MBC7095412.1 hypothetical protein [Thermococcus sp.]
MSRKIKSQIVIALMAMASISGLYYLGNLQVQSAIPLEMAEKGDLIRFTGLCVASKENFAVLYNGNETIVLFETLEQGKVYNVTGKLTDPDKGYVEAFEINQTSAKNLPLETLTGAYWVDGYCQLLTPQRITLNTCLNASKGEKVQIQGLYYNKKFYVVNYARLGFEKSPEDGMPFLVTGSVLYGGNPATIWNGEEEIKVYLPYKQTLNVGDYVEVVGIARLYSTLTIYVDDKSDVRILGMARKSPIGEEKIGEIAYGSCAVKKSTKTYIGLNCTSLPLYGFSAKIGDTIHFEAIRRKNSLYCLECKVSRPREALENSICNPSPQPSKIEGRVEWVKFYSNGFGIANITNGKCWVLLKLPKSLGISLEEGDHVVTFGFHTTYREKPAFEVASKEDVIIG